jgi:hypothetical protein
MTQLTMRVEDLILPGPLEFQDQIRVSLATNDYAASSTGLPRLDRGFNVKGDTAGDYQGITLAQFRRALFNKSYGELVSDPFSISDGERNDILQAIAADPDEGKVAMRLQAGQWNDTPLVFVEKTASPDTSVDIGII